MEAALPLLAALLLFASLGPKEADARLLLLQQDFSGRPKAEAMGDLARLAEDAEGTDAAGRAWVWLGDLRRQAGDPGGAEAAYRRAYGGRTEEASHRLSARGLGDLALAARHLEAAAQLFAEASVGAPAPLAEELRQKRARIDTLRRRGRLEWLAWSLVALSGILLGRGVRRPLRAPIELWFVLPIYGLFLAGGAGRDPDVFVALAGTAAGSIVLIGLFGLGERAGRRLRTAALLILGNLALLAAVLNRAGLVDRMLDTLAL